MAATSEDPRQRWRRRLPFDVFKKSKVAPKTVDFEIDEYVPYGPSKIHGDGSRSPAKRFKAPKSPREEFEAPAFRVPVITRATDIYLTDPPVEQEEHYDGGGFADKLSFLMCTCGMDVMCWTNSQHHDDDLGDNSPVEVPLLSREDEPDDIFSSDDDEEGEEECPTVSHIPPR